MSTIAVDLQNLYSRQFGSKPIVPSEVNNISELPKFVIEGSSNYSSTTQGSNLIADYMGQEVWLPVVFRGLDYNKFGVSEILLPYTVVKISGKKTFIKTPLSERGGTVKELYSIDDYDISIRGFLIDKNRVFPEKELKVLQQLYALNESIELDNALTNVFTEAMNNKAKVVIEAFDLPEVEGGRKHVRPFAMRLSSDSIFTLEVE